MTDASSTSRAAADAYSAVAALYADLPRDDLERLPLDRAALAAFAEHVRAGSPGTVAELGCGPGPVTAHLRDLGLDVFGIDLSSALIDIARETYPDLRFEVGSMDALDLADDELRGIVSWFSIIHALPEEVPGFFAEFSRVLAPGGHLLLGFFEAGDGPVEPFDHKVATAYQWPAGELARLGREAGFVEVGRVLREAVEGERDVRRGNLVMRLGE
ncbi:class I SAM-dependent methyltransferase [Saccharopolyspora indica]|uniref:class I SAM-dependent DNA methyltransferase n=1 Tax=Saccharopolyspora indica TaxID=1229659 RepID=UPI0022EA1C75|nr:class I SAM-dependent methyltransferase [Saccharopolyspora indica]MDA3649665.1 class I SAM-dependent methyltransferase [Saccharopolyspora indica]